MIGPFQKQSALLLILICIFAACSGRNENLLVETEIPKEAGEEDTLTEHGKSTFRLAAWNIRIFSDGSRTDDELHHIAEGADRLRLYRYR